jgi:hypothetical protein
MRERSRRFRKWLLITVIILGICGVVLSVTIHYVSQSLGTFELFKNYGCLGGTPYKHSEIERRGRFKLPASYRNLDASSIAWQDCVIYIKFEMDAAELPMLLKSTYISKSLTQTTNPSSFSNIPPELNWNLAPSGKYLEGEGNNGREEYQEIVVDVTNPDHYIVYLITALL